MARTASTPRICETLASQIPSPQLLAKVAALEEEIEKQKI
jgi:hypothetical protein